MPYPPYLKNNVAAILDFLLPLFTVLSFCFIVPPAIKRVVHEKESGVKVRKPSSVGKCQKANVLKFQELMKLVGLPNWMHWTSWYLNAIVTSAISIFVMVILICIEWKPGAGKVEQYKTETLIRLL